MVVIISFSGNRVLVLDWPSRGTWVELQRSRSLDIESRAQWPKPRRYFFSYLEVCRIEVREKDKSSMANVDIFIRYAPRKRSLESIVRRIGHKDG